METPFALSNAGLAVPGVPGQKSFKFGNNRQSNMVGGAGTNSNQGQAYGAVSGQQYVPNREEMKDNILNMSCENSQPLLIRPIMARP